MIGVPTGIQRRWRDLPLCAECGCPPRVVADEADEQCAVLARQLDMAVAALHAHAGHVADLQKRLEDTQPVGWVAELPPARTPPVRPWDGERSGDTDEISDAERFDAFWGEQAERVDPTPRGRGPWWRVRWDKQVPLAAAVVLCLAFGMFALLIAELLGAMGAPTLGVQNPPVIFEDRSSRDWYAEISP